MSHLFTIACPCGCGQECRATDAGFAATTVDVVTCLGRPKRLRKSEAYRLADELEVAEGGLLHRDGLVVLGRNPGRPHSFAAETGYDRP